LTVGTWPDYLIILFNLRSQQNCQENALKMVHNSLNILKKHKKGDL